MTIISRIYPPLLAAIVCGVALLLRIPLITVDAPYLYQEDDGHHFNRTVEMYKRGSLDPIDYFNKPALHFYLRLPITALAVREAKKLGELKSSSEIRTRDPYGLSQLAYTTSHPRILYWNRAWSIFLSILLVLTTFVCTFHLVPKAGFAAFAALVPALSLEVLRNSHIVGVDVQMALMCLLSSTSAVVFLKDRPRLALTLSSIFAGLAAATKYNAAPAAIVPAIVALYQPRGNKLFSLVIAGLLTIFTFLVVTPYSLMHLNEAITDIKYELWHYSVEGHAGHSTERGIPQALFYLNWLVTEGVGYSVAVLVLIGVAISWLPLKQHAPLLIVLLGFPLGYSALMIMQKTNFTRNMVAVVPYVGIFAGLGLAAATRSLRSASLSGPIALLIGALSLYPLVFSDVDYLQRSSKQIDSRTELVTWLKTARSPYHDVAISGDLQLPIQTFSLPGVDAFNPDKTSISDLFNAGYSYVVFSHQEQLSLPAPNNFFSLVKEIPGDPQSSLRIPRNPPITIAFFDPSTPQGTVENAIEAKKRVAISLTNPARLGCERGEEPHCWISSRATEISLAKDTPELPNGVITLTMTTPWEAQEVSITSQKSPSTSVKFPLPVGQHHTIELPLAAFPLTVTLTQIHSPEGQGVSGDTRRLGVTLAR